MAQAFIIQGLAGQLAIRSCDLSSTVYSMMACQFFKAATLYPELHMVRYKKRMAPWQSLTIQRVVHVDGRQATANLPGGNCFVKDSALLFISFTGKPVSLNVVYKVEGLLDGVGLNKYLYIRQ